VHQLVYLPLLMLFFSLALRGPQDFPALGTVLVAAAMAKALQALWVRHVMDFDIATAPTATSHADSMLFAVAICILLVRLIQQPSPRALAWALALLPVLAFAVRANNRRLAWVEVAAALALVAVVAPRTRLKVKAMRLGVFLAPVLALYLALGWNGTARIFGPVAKIRSIVDSGQNRSTAERDVENYNLTRNIRERPLLGMGFGHEYTVWVMPDDISAIFPQWRYLPHNSVLGIFTFAGLFGTFAIWSVFAVGLFLAARACALARAPPQRAAALVSMTVVLIYWLQCYGDMGMISWNSVFLLAPALVVAGKLAVVTGAWPTAPGTHASA
jgi:hypothetical protein